MAHLRGIKNNILFSLLLAAVFTIVGVHAVGPPSINGVDQPCDHRNALCIQNAYCSDEKCKCNEGYVSSFNKNTCLEEATEWEGKCIETAQCYKFDGALCVNGACHCTENHHFSDGKCWITRRLKEECADDNECLLWPHANRIECQNSVCECKHGFEINDIGDDCNGASVLWTVGLSTLLFMHLIKSLVI